VRNVAQAVAREGERAAARYERDAFHANCALLAYQARGQQVAKALRDLYDHCAGDEVAAVVGARIVLAKLRIDEEDEREVGE